MPADRHPCSGFEISHILSWIHPHSISTALLLDCSQIHPPQHTHTIPPFRVVNPLALTSVPPFHLVGFAYMGIQMGNDGSILKKGGGGGREVQEGGDTRILIADSLWCTAETNTTYKAIIFQLGRNLNI